MLIAVTLATMIWAAAASDPTCDLDSMTASGCSSVTGSLGPDSAILEGTTGSGGNDTGGGGAGGSGDSEASPRPPKCLGRVIVKEGECFDPQTPTTPGPVTLSDIASFRPQVGSNLMQPNGWAVVGLDTNFYSRGGIQIVPGTLLGGPAEVRFTPVAWHWAYGDGGSRVAGTAGGTWAELGIPEFDSTPTSHVYRAKGSYTITLSIDYAAEYRLGSGEWVPIRGVLSLPSNPLNITAGTAKTVLVEDDCRANPRGPGC